MRRLLKLWALLIVFAVLPAQRAVAPEFVASRDASSEVGNCGASRPLPGLLFANRSEKARSVFRSRQQTEEESTIPPVVAKPWAVAVGLDVPLVAAAPQLASARSDVRAVSSRARGTASPRGPPV